MIQQASSKKFSQQGLDQFALQNEIVFKLKQEGAPQSDKNLVAPDLGGDLAVKSQNSQSSNSTAHLDLGSQISKLIKIYSQKQSEDVLTFDQFKELAKDLYSIIEPRELTNQELNNLVNLFDQKQKDPKDMNKPPKSTITKDELKKKATQNKGSLGFFKKK